MHRRLFLVALLLAAGVPAAPSWAAQGHWLIGTWTGQVERLTPKDSQVRVLIVKLVEGENVDLRFGFPDSRGTSAMRGTLRNGELRLVTPGSSGGNMVILRRNGDDELAGTFFVAASGSSYPIKLRRQ